VPYGDILDYLEEEESNMATGSKTMDNQPPKTHLPGLNGKVAEISDEAVDEHGLTYQENIDAVKNKFRKPGNSNGNGNGNGKKKEKGKGKPKNGQNGNGNGGQNGNGNGGNAKESAPVQQYNGAKPKYVRDENKVGFGLPCHMCKQVGHWQRDCPHTDKFAKFLKSEGHIQATITRQAPMQQAQHGPKEMDPHYQAFLELKFGTSGVSQVDAPFKGDAYNSLGSGKDRAEM